MAACRLLVFVGSEGIYHDHLGQGRFLANTLTEGGDVEAEFSRDYAVLAEGLNEYDALLCYTDVGTLTDPQEQGLLAFVHGGGGFFGLHTAAASFQDRDAYHAMLNARFAGHSPYMDFTVKVVDPEHPITRGLADFSARDELYYLKHEPERAHHLLEAYDPTKDETHVMAFTSDYGRGRIFYFALGHDMAVLTNASFQKVIRRGVLWAARRL